VVASDIDAVILRIQELLGVTYDQAQTLFKRGIAVLSVPVSDSQITVSTTVASAIPQPSSSQTAKTTAYYNASPVSDTPFTIFTPTAGKTAYLTGAYFYQNGGQAFRFGDNISGVTLPADEGVLDGFLINGGAAAAAFTVTFPSPVPIVTALKGVANGTAAITGSFNYFEVTT